MKGFGDFSGESSSGNNPVRRVSVGSLRHPDTTFSPYDTLWHRIYKFGFFGTSAALITTFLIFGALLAFRKLVPNSNVRATETPSLPTPAGMVQQMVVRTFPGHFIKLGGVQRDLLNNQSMIFRSEAARYRTKVQNVFESSPFSSLLKDVEITEFRFHGTQHVKVRFNVSFILFGGVSLRGEAVKIILLAAVRKNETERSPFFGLVISEDYVHIGNGTDKVISDVIPVLREEQMTTSTKELDSTTPPPTTTELFSSTVTESESETPSSQRFSSTEDPLTSLSPPETTLLTDTSLEWTDISDMFNPTTTHPLSEICTSKAQGECSDGVIDYCRNLGYSSVFYPNWFGHKSEEEVLAALSFFQVLEAMECSELIQNFTCALLQPSCIKDPEEPAPLCRSFCKRVLRECSDLFADTYFGMKLDCRTFPDSSLDSDKCIQGCSPNDFVCPESQFCIHNASRCDSMLDCGATDYSDERFCGCEEGQFTCSKSGKCIQPSYLCNNYNDCDDWEDEKNCTCSDGMRQCKTMGQCFPDTMWCNYEFDCEDKSDEMDCPCSDTDFRCQTGGFCKPSHMRCDGRNDCGDFSDEFDCECGKFEFRCDEYLCKSYIKHWCNKRADCLDKSDEPIGCECKNYQFRCDNGQCIPIHQQCDGRPQCFDNSDETHCRCSELEFDCGQGLCLPQKAVCDGRIQCPGGIDENQNCSCPSNRFSCGSGSGKCVPLSWWCDGRKDCSDGSDEVPDCQQTCPTEFPLKCELATGRRGCLAAEKLCDGNSDCTGREDESNCTCDPLTQFSCSNGMCKSWNVYCNGVPDCPDLSDEPEDCVCNPLHQLSCLDGSCYGLEGRCDGRPDCLDVSDERGCTCAQYMEGDERKKLCDSVLDCADFSDEKACASCQESSFTCDNGGCVPMENVCDGSSDCSKGEDERYCLVLLPEETANNSTTSKYWEYPNTGYLSATIIGERYFICGDTVAGLAEKELDLFGQKLCQRVKQNSLISLKLIQIPGSYQQAVITNPSEPNPNNLRTFPKRCSDNRVLYLTCGDPECGLTPNFETARARIVGGERAGLGMWPFYTAVYHHQRQWCGGTLIHPEWILSAAHCFKESRLQLSDSDSILAPFHFLDSLAEEEDDFYAADLQKDAEGKFTVSSILGESLVVRAGLYRNSSFGPFDQSRQVSHVIRHSNYHSKSGRNDIALLKLERPFHLSPYVLPACLPLKDELKRLPSNTRCYTVGLGSQGWKLPASDLLRYVSIPVMDSETCRNFPTINVDYKIEDTQLCAGYPEGGKDACQGDSGGPLLCQTGDEGRWTLIGVTSRGYSCASPLTPGVYTKVDKYLQWIRQVIRSPLPDKFPRCEEACLLGLCLEAQKICDGRRDCEFGEDEWDCPIIFPTTNSTLSSESPCKATCHKYQFCSLFDIIGFMPEIHSYAA